MMRPTIVGIGGTFLAVLLVLAGFRLASQKREIALLQEQVTRFESITAAAESAAKDAARESEQLRAQYSELRTTVQQLQAGLAASTHVEKRADETTGALIGPPAEDVVQGYTAAALQGDPAGLRSLAMALRDAQHVLSTNSAASDEERDRRTRQLLSPFWSAFDTLTSAAANGDQNALRALAQAARLPELSGLALRALGKLAGQGLEGALDVVLEPRKFGVDIPLASTVGALRPAAENGNARAIDALAAVADDDRNQPLWYMAAQGLTKAAEAGNATAIDALVSMARSTNINIQRAVRPGLSAAAANQNPKASEALQQINAR